MISRSEVLARSKTIWPAGKVPYSQGTLHKPDGYRQDCSGYVSMCWAIPLKSPDCWGGMSTTTLLSRGWMHEIPVSDLKPGDAVGICGPNTAGNDGHITLFVRWLNKNPNDNHYYMREQSGGTSGWTERLVDWPGYPYKAYRFNYIIDDVVVPSPQPGHTPSPEPKTKLHRTWPSYMKDDEYFGLISGPYSSHGGFYWAERTDVKAIQQRLITLGFVQGIINPSSSWADGVFERQTFNAVAKWQKAKYASTTSRYGEVWRDDWYRLFTY